MIEIPLSNGAANAHQIFFIALGENFVEFKVNYLTNFDQWFADVYVLGELKMAGVALKPYGEISITYFDAGIGRLYMSGKEPTLDNLGVENHLYWAAS